MNITDLLSQSLTTSRFALSTIFAMNVDRFGRSLRFCHLEFDMEVIIAGIVGGVDLKVILESF